MINENIKGIMRVSTILLFLTMVISMAKAQGKADNSATNSKLSADLSISAQTAQSLKAALGSPDQGIKDIQENKQLSPKQKQQQMAELLARRHRAIDSLLTPEQKKAFLQRVAAAREASYSKTTTDTSRTNH